MARVLCIDDFQQYAEMIAVMLEQKGHHEVRTEIVPFDLAEIQRFEPDVIIVNLSRKSEAIGRPLADFYAEVEGAKALRSLKESQDLARYPMIVTAIAVEERELPPGFDYLAYIEVPGKFDYILATIDRIVATHGEHLAKE